MVRVLACHHFQGQQIGQCEEAVGVTLADNVIIIALENKISIYSALKVTDLQDWLRTRREKLEFGNGELGKYFTFKRPGPPAAKEHIDVKKGDIGNQLVLFHSFAPVDVIKSISYNQRGHYLLSLERPDMIGGNSETHSVRAYFEWDRKADGKPMVARVAGLVSPTGGESSESNLKMIEIPPVPLFATRAVASCQLTGNIASLSSDARVNIYVFKVKEGLGRSKTQYADFDLACTIQLSGPNFSPQRISFALDFICCSDSSQVSALRIISNYVLDSPKKKPGFDLFNRSKPAPNEKRRSHGLEMNGLQFQHIQSLPDDVVVFDPKVESVKVYLRTISKLNRKTRHPNLIFNEEFQEDITLNKSKIISSHGHLDGQFTVEDLLKMSWCGSPTVPEVGSNDFIQVELSAIRIKDSVGGVCCAIATSKEVFLYSFPIKRESFVTRVSSHPFTSNLISFSLGDSLFLHAITESGLESYTMRSMYFPLKEVEGFELYENDCPLQDECPILVGIRPFVGVRFMAANKHSLCLLSSPPVDFATNSTVVIPSAEEISWTIYSLQLPSMELLYQDIFKAAQLHQQPSPESYLNLICELHVLLRLTINENPKLDTLYRTKYLETCRLIGLEYFRKSAREYSTSATGTAPSLDSDELIDKGVTFLRMAGCSLQWVFASENSKLTKDPALASGIARFIQIHLPIASMESDSGLSPTLSNLIVEFLAKHSANTLVDLVLNVQWLRDCSSKRLVEILMPIAETQKYKTAETLALLLSLVARHGEDSTGRSKVKQVLSKCQNDELESKFKLPWLLCQNNKQYSVSDLTICLSAAKSQVHINVLSRALQQGEITLNDVVVAFAQGVNLNSDAEIQHCLSLSLSSILENYFVERLKLRNNEDATSPGTKVQYSQDEARALHTLVRSYLTNISANIQSPTTESIKSHHENHDEISENGILQDEQVLGSPNEMVFGSDEKTESKWQMFGKTPTFVSLIVSGIFIDEKCVPPTSSPFSSLESRENFIKLSSLLGSDLRRADGVSGLILATLKQNTHVMDIQIQKSLELLSESCERAIDILMENYTTVLMLYAREMFGKSTRCWKILVSKLKDKIKSKSAGAENFTTIIESVYLHVANTLSPTQLEQVLDKEEENAKFYSACRRVELANTFNEKVINMSSAYLDQAK